MQYERLTHQRKNGIKTGFWVDSKTKKEDIVQRLGQYENSGLSPAEVMAFLTVEDTDPADFEKFLKEAETALEEYKKNCVKPPGYESRLCVMAETLTGSIAGPVELRFSASEIKRVLDLAKKR
ncbi:MAG: hypothetical protein U0L05_01230 [Schaedlerella sp.]|nr:hypothetical protein [Schaedlerella sp.]